MSQSLQVVVIGAGFFSQFHLDAWQRMDGAILSAIVELDTGRRKQLALDFPDAKVFASIEDALQHVPADIIDVVTPPASHVSVVRKVFALTHEQAVVSCQKPFCSSATEAGDLARQASQQGRTLVVHENFRFQPWYTHIKTMIDNGELGEVLQACFRLRPGDGRGADAYLSRQPYFQKMQRFLIHETGIHWIDTFRYLFGEPDWVYADLAQLNPHIAGEDSGIFVFNYTGGLRVMLDANRHLDHSTPDKRLTMGEMTVEGTRSTLRLDGEGRLFLREFGKNDEHPVRFEFEKRGFAGDSVYLLNRHIVDHLISNQPLNNVALDYLRNIELEELVYQSAESGKRLACEKSALDLSDTMRSSREP